MRETKLQSTSPESTLRVLVLDASAIINFLGTGVAAQLLQLLDPPLLIAGRTFREVRRHPIPRLDHVTELSSLTATQALALKNLDPRARDLFFELTAAEPPDGLDDGEAAAIALAVSSGVKAVPVLDDRKARRIWRERWPSRAALYSIELLSDPRILAGMDRPALADAVHMALTHARMRVPVHARRWVVELIGEKRAAGCPSLGSAARMLDTNFVLDDPEETSALNARQR